ncbi:MAG: 3-dehydroquinate synthase [Lachnospiraceae bacterium]|nr:3-dehydroquinate synthase [Lachnospiraceae bacterium]
MANKITVHYEGKPLYDITIARDYNGLGSILQELDLSGRKMCIVTDSHVEKHYLRQVQDAVAETASYVCEFSFPAGEASKTLEVIEDLYEVLIKAHFDRKDVLLALGGGVVGDMTGYAAATYLRGIRVVQLPTSLLAMVDSSIGGKTGVDFRGYKNMIGAFHQPSAVYMNISALKTLTDEQYFSGFGEIIKHGLIKDIDYFNEVGSAVDALRQRDLTTLEDVIYRSCQIKRRVVENDPKEQGERALLNFGHTLGHAIEKLKDFQMLHGQCVAVGMMAAAYISKKREMIDDTEYLSIENTIKGLELPVSVSNLKVDDIIRVSKNDKKMNAGQIRFILLQNMGNAVITEDVTDEEMAEALEAVLHTKDSFGE